MSFLRMAEEVGTVRLLKVIVIEVYKIMGIFEQALGVVMELQNE